MQDKNKESKAVSKKTVKATKVVKVKAPEKAKAVTKVTTFAKKYNLVPVITPLLRTHNKTILACVHVVICQLLGLNPITSLISYAKVTAIYSNGKKAFTVYGKSGNRVIVKDALNCLNGNASNSTLKKFKTSLTKLSGNTAVFTDYLVFFCNANNLDIKKSITQIRQNKALSSNAYADTLKQALNNVKAA